MISKIIRTIILMPLIMCLYPIALSVAIACALMFFLADGERELIEEWLTMPARVFKHIWGIK